jgi:hypothetical protein
MPIEQRLGGEERLGVGARESRGAQSTLLHCCAAARSRAARRAPRRAGHTQAPVWASHAAGAVHTTPVQGGTPARTGESAKGGPATATPLPRSYEAISPACGVGRAGGRAA